MLESLGFNPEKIEAEYARQREEWYQALYEHDMGWCDDHQVWAEPDYSDENWKTMELPGYWEDKEIHLFCYCYKLLFQFHCLKLSNYQPKLLYLLEVLSFYLFLVF